MLDSKIPPGRLEEKWTDYKGHCKLVNPANKRKLEIISNWYRPGGRQRCSNTGRTGLPGKSFLLPGFATACAFHCRTGWY